MQQNYMQERFGQLRDLLADLQHHLDDRGSASSDNQCRLLLNEAITLATSGAESSLPNDVVNRLTKREQEIAHALSTGISNGVIAARLFISVNTVRFHIRNILRKLNAKNRSEAAAMVLRSSMRED